MSCDYNQNFFELDFCRRDMAEYFVLTIFHRSAWIPPYLLLPLTLSSASAMSLLACMMLDHVVSFHNQSMLSDHKHYIRPRRLPCVQNSCHLCIVEWQRVIVQWHAGSSLQNHTSGEEGSYLQNCCEVKLENDDDLYHFEEEEQIFLLECIDYTHAVDM